MVEIFSIFFQLNHEGQVYILSQTLNLFTPFLFTTIRSKTVNSEIFTRVFDADPDEMLHSAEIHLGLYCLPKYTFRGCQYTKG